jgi:hypothetical protein
VHVDESLLETLLSDVLCVFSVSSEAHRNGENLSLVPPHQDFERAGISPFGR